MSDSPLPRPSAARPPAGARARHAVATGVLSVAMLACAGAQSDRSIVIDAARVFPESITSSADGTIWIGGSATGAVYRATPGAARAQAWITSEAAGTSRVLGVFADDAAKTLWVCAPSANARGDAPAVPTAVKAFGYDAALKRSYGFAGGGSCNDMAVARDGTVYASDFGGGRVMRLRPGGTEFEAWAADPRLASADGIVVLGDGSVYVNTFRSGLLFRIPVGADGAAGTLTPIRTPRPLVLPDGMRGVGPDTMLLVEGEGRLVEVTVKGAEASLRTIREGFANGPTAVTLTGGTAYVIEAKFNYRSDPKLREQDPGVFEAVPVAYRPAR